MKIVLMLVLFLFLLTGCSQDENTSNYSTERTTYEVNVSFDYTTSNQISSSQVREPEELFVYKTTIYTKTDARQNNVKLACSQLNDSVIAPGETFSFCDTLRAS